MFSERELGEMLANSALLLQRTTRRVTKMYDRALGAVGLTANQFGLLASLVAMSARVSMGRAWAWLRSGWVWTQRH